MFCTQLHTNHTLVFPSFAGDEVDLDGPELELEQLAEEERDGEVERKSDAVEASPGVGAGVAFPAIWSEEGKYLATVLGDALVKGLTQVSQDRPNDPVEYLANFLKTYKNGEVLASNIPEEVQARLKSGRAVSPALIERLTTAQGQNKSQEVIEEDSDQEGQESIEDQENKLDTEAKHLISKLESDGEDDDDNDTDHINDLGEMEDPTEMTENEENSGQNGTRDDRGQSVLHFAAARPGGASTILAFLQNPSVNLSWRDERGRTARDVATGLGRYENVKTIDGWIVSLAVAGDKDSLQQLLVDGYSDFSIEENNMHVIDLAEKAGKRDVALFLRSIPDFKDKLEKLHRAVRTGDLEQVKQLTLKDNRLTMALNEKGRTALHVGVLCEQFAIVKWLCEQFGGSVLKRGDALERTPLHYAMGIEKVEKMTRTLVRNGAKRVVKDLRGRQPSYYFINREEIVKLQNEEKSYNSE